MDKSIDKMKGKIIMTKNNAVIVKRDTSGKNRFINIKKAKEGWGIPAILWNYEIEPHPDDIISQYGITEYEGLYECKTGTVIVSKNELIRAIDNSSHWPYIRINDGFSSRSKYSLVDSNDKAVYAAVSSNNFEALPDTLYRVTFWYAGLDENDEWCAPEFRVDIIK